MQPYPRVLQQKMTILEDIALVTMGSERSLYINESKHSCIKLHAVNTCFCSNNVE